MLMSKNDQNCLHTVDVVLGEGGMPFKVTEKNGLHVTLHFIISITQQ